MPQAATKAPGKATREKKQAAAGKVAPKKNPGTPAHVPTEKDRNIVSLCMASGFTYEQTARLVGVSLPTLTKHYADELENGAARMNAAVAKNLYSLALQQNDRKVSLSASIFIAKTRMRWREHEDASATIEADGPVRVTLKIGNRPEVDA